jgi:hypothetical protein
VEADEDTNVMKCFCFELQSLGLLSIYRDLRLSLLVKGTHAYKVVKFLLLTD